MVEHEKPSTEALLAKEERFSAKEADAYVHSWEGRKMLAMFFVSAMLNIWPYQTMVQAQTFLSRKFPEAENSISPMMMVMTTLPLALTHTVNMRTGYEAGLDVRVLIPCSMVALIMTSLIVLLLLSHDQMVLLIAMYAAAFLNGCCASFAEPAYWEMAGLLPSAHVSQALMTGIAFAGVVVAAVQMLARLASDGLSETPLDSLEKLTHFFLGVTAVAAVLQALLFWAVIKPSESFKKYIKAGVLLHQQQHQQQHHHPEAAAIGDADGMTASAAQTEALRYMSPSVWCLLICFGSTTLLWPSIPGAACVDVPKEGSVWQSWWFQLVIFAFNLGDLLGRLEPKSLAWGANYFGPLAQQRLALLRASVFAVFVISSSAPQQYSPFMARWVALISIFFFGASNGWLSTVCFMRAPRALPSTAPNVVAEQASAMCASGVYWGLLCGSIVSQGLTTYPLHSYLGKCFEH